jgi:hypothetical protein
MILFLFTAMTSSIYPTDTATWITPTPSPSWPTATEDWQIPTVIPSTANPSSTESSESLSGAAIAGITAGAVIFILLIVVGICFYRSRSRRGQSKKYDSIDDRRLSSDQLIG